MAGKEGAPKPIDKKIEKASRTRAEVGERRYSPEEREKHEALEYLKKVGFLRSVNDEEMLHGRSRPGDESKFTVDAEHDNGGNKGGNGKDDKHLNWNKVSALSTGNRFVAEQYAKVRSGGDKSREEIYRITSNDPEASVIDTNYRAKDKKEERKVNEALRKLQMPISEASPFDFEDRSKIPFSKLKLRLSSFARKKAGFFDKVIPDTDIPLLSAALGDSGIAKHIASASNSRLMVRDYRSVQSFAHKLLKNDMHFDGASYDAEYMTSWMRNAHIVGLRERLNSTRVRDKNGKRVDFNNNFMLDLERVDTEERNERARRKRMQTFGRLALKIDSLMEVPATAVSGKRPDRLVAGLEADSFIRPEQIIDLAKKVPGYKDVFEADSGVWEKFTLEEHTGTMLRLFDENFADKIPAKLLPITRLSILIHDIGKSEAAKLPEYKNAKTRAERDLIQSAYNESYAIDFLDKIGISPENQELILGMIGEGKELMAEARIIPGVPNEKRKKASDALNSLCLRLAKECLGGGEEEARGIRQLCYIIQMCDSAAYTTIAKTRDASSGIFYRNSSKSSFNKTFESSVNIFNGGGRRLHIAEGNK